jgi:hypothetical protein
MWDEVLGLGLQVAVYRGRVRTGEVGVREKASVLQGVRRGVPQVKMDVLVRRREDHIPGLAELRREVGRRAAEVPATG